MYYGWKIVMVTFVTHFISVGFIFYSYGVFFKALSAEFGGGRLGISLGLMIMNVVNAFFAPYLGRILDHRSIRNIMTFGVLSLSVGFLIASRVQTLLQFYLVLGTFMGMGAAMVGGLPSSTLVSNWFIRRRGTALGIATMGVSLSGMIMAPVTTQLVAHLGWRTTFVVYGVIAVVIILPLVRRFIENRPEDLGLHPDGVAPEWAMSPDAVDEPALPLAPGDSMIDHPGHLEWSSVGVLRDRNFWAIALATSLTFSCISALLTHMVPHMTDLGYSPEKAAFALSACAGSGVIGKLWFGWIADRIDIRLAFWIAIFFQFVGMAMVQFTQTYPALILTSAVFGLGMGGIIPLSSALVGQVFGRRFFARTTGLMSPMMLPLQVLGVPMAGYIFDLTGSYMVAFKTYLVLYVIASLMLLLVKLPNNDAIHHREGLAHS